MLLLLTLTTLWSSLRGSFTMRRGLGGGEAPFSCGDQAFIRRLLGDATDLLHTTLD